MFSAALAAAILTMAGASFAKDAALVIGNADYAHGPHSVWGITARNSEQNFALNLLMDPEIDFVTLLGTAGTGKTLLTLAAGALVDSVTERRNAELSDLAVHVATRGRRRPIVGASAGRDGGFVLCDVDSEVFIADAYFAHGYAGGDGGVQQPFQQKPS